MKVSDKELDQLFSSKLADMEMEPSTTVWSSIADELDGKQKDKKAGIPFMRIAASVVVMMGISLFFLRPAKQRVALHGSVANVTNTVNPSSPVIDPIPSQTVEEQTTEVAQTETPVKHQSKITSGDVAGMLAKKVDSVNNTTPYIANNEPVQNVKPQLIAASNTQQGVTIAEMQNSSVTKINDTEPVKNTDIKPIAAITTEKKPIDPVKKRKIHTLGDLLNVVIAKVDKREDKLIEFTNTSDDDSFNITGLNLGILRAKKDK